MEPNKIIRTVSIFSNSPSSHAADTVAAVISKLEGANYTIQTKRLVSTLEKQVDLMETGKSYFDYTSVGAITYQQAVDLMPTFLAADNLAFNIDLANEDIDARYTDLLFDIIRAKPAKTFNFAYTFNNAASSPYFPSARYESNGFAVGLQPTNLAQGCQTLEGWLSNMQSCWDELVELFADDPEFLGIDSSIAPIGSGDSSFVHFVKRLKGDFEPTVTSDLYSTITRFIKEQNPKPIGLCGLMLPCLEDAELAAEYEVGKFLLERNIFLSLHSGLGIDTYPIGIDEKPERVVEILKLLQALSNKYNKPLSARFSSDGKAKIGDRTDFQNHYLADCTVRAL